MDLLNSCISMLSRDSLGGTHRSYDFSTVVVVVLFKSISFL